MLSSLLIYLSVFFGAAALSYFAVKKQFRALSVFAVAIPSLLIGLRFGVGTDYDAYVYMHQLFLNLNLSEFLSITDDTKTEIGFFVIIKIASLFTSEPWGMFMISSILTIPVAYIAIKRMAGANTPYAFLLYLLLLSPFVMNGVRQGIAISFVFLAISYLMSGSGKKYLANIIMATLFHSSALMLLPLYLLKFAVKDRKKGQWLNVLTSTLPALTVAILTPLILAISPSIPVLAQYTSYTGDLTGISATTLIMKGFLVFIVLMTFKVTTKSNKNTRIILSLILLELVFISLGMISGVFARLQYYVAIGGILYLATLPNFFSNNSKRIVYLIAILYGLVYFLLAYYIAGYSDIFPYKTILETY